MGFHAHRAPFVLPPQMTDFFFLTAPTCAILPAWWVNELPTVLMHLAVAHPARLHCFRGLHLPAGCRTCCYRLLPRAVRLPRTTACCCLGTFAWDVGTTCLACYTTPALRGYHAICLRKERCMDACYALLHPSPVLQDAAPTAASPSCLPHPASTIAL